MFLEKTSSFTKNQTPSQTLLLPFILKILSCTKYRLRHRLKSKTDSVKESAIDSVITIRKNLTLY